MLVPEPVGFSDPVKRAAAHAERRWEAATGLFASGAVTATAGIAAGVAIPPVAAPILLAVAASGFYVKLRAKWAKEDPPRPDYTSPAELPRRSVTFEPLLIASAYDSVALARMLVVAVVAGDRLGAAIESLEKSMGAAIDVRPDDGTALELWQARMHEARAFATETGFALHGLAQLALAATEETDSWIDSPIEPVRWAPHELVGALDISTVGLVAAAGLWPDLRRLDEAGIDASDTTTSMGEALRACSAASRELGYELLRWASGDDGTHPVERGPGGSSGGGSPREPVPEAPAVEEAVSAIGV